MFYPLQVVEAMRTSISNMVGVLPPHYFDVTVSTMGENLAQLMFSVIMTGAHTGCGPLLPSCHRQVCSAASVLDRNQS